MVQNFIVKGLAFALLLASSSVASEAWAQAQAQPSAKLCTNHDQCNPASGGFCMQGTCRNDTDRQLSNLFQVAVAPFTDLSPTGEGTNLVRRAAPIIRGMLRSTGFFSPLKQKNTPPSSHLEGWKPTTILFSTWSEAGAYILVKGVVERITTGELMIELFTYNVETGEKIEIPHSRFLASEYNIKEQAMPWCNAFTKVFTGRSGILGSRIAYSRRDHNPKSPKEIWTVGLDGFHEEQVTDNGSINILPSWESRGQNVAYTSYKDGNPNLYLNGGIFSGRPNMNTSADWSPNGNLVAITLGKDGNSEVYLLDATTGKVVKRLTSHHAIDSSPSWSPDGKWISFVSDRTGSPQIYIMDNQGKRLRRVTTQHGYCTSPDWSPAGNLIAYNAMMEGGRFDLFVLNPNTGQKWRLTHGSGSNEDPSWSPDGRHIVFSSTRGSTRGKPQRHLYIIPAQGGKAQRLTHGNVQYFPPTWSPR